MWHFCWTEWHSTAEIRANLWVTLRDISDGRCDIPLRRFRLSCGWLYVTFLVDGVTFHWRDSGEFVGDFTWHFWWTEWHSTAEIQAKLWVTLRDISDGRCDIPLRRFRLICGCPHVTFMVGGVTFHYGDSGEFVGDFTWHFWWTKWHRSVCFNAISFLRAIFSPAFLCCHLSHPREMCDGLE